MAKYFIHNLVITGALCAFATTASFAEAAPTLATAQKAYVNGNWKVAAAAYEQVCPNEPENTRTECYLWNVLALSQTGIAADFSKAGKRLDSLIDKTNPQQAIYADLMMTKAQFQMYLGRYNKAAESLVHAIETSQPHQVTVLQKVCATALQNRLTKASSRTATTTLPILFLATALGKSSLRPKQRPRLLSALPMAARHLAACP